MNEENGLILGRDDSSKTRWKNLFDLCRNNNQFSIMGLLSIDQLEKEFNELENSNVTLKHVFSFSF
jgi:hypothetical protein